MIAIFYFVSTQHQITVTYYMFIYYYTGNVIFSLILQATIVLMVDRPIYAIINMKTDIEEAENSKDYKLDDQL